MKKKTSIILLALLVVCCLPAVAATNTQELLAQKELSFNFVSILKGILGMVTLLAVAWLFSTDRKNIKWSTVFKALALQFFIAISVIALPAVQYIFEFVGQGFIAVLNWTNAGTRFLFGPLVDGSLGYIFAFSIIPTVIFFAALTSLLFYFGIIQKVVWAMGWVLTKFMNLSGAESLSCAGNIFLGQTEAPLMVKEYIPKMTNSEIMLIMVSGMSTMAGGVLAAYISMLGNGDPALELEFAKHLLSASVMAAPGAIAFAKILKPQTDEIDNSVTVSKEKIGKNALDALSNGTGEGLKLAANIGAMLLVFYALIAGVNSICFGFGDLINLNGVIANATDGRFAGLTIEYIMSIVFYPIIWLLGLPLEDIPLVGRLLGEKLILTEFMGYQSLTEMIQSGAFTSSKSIVMSTYMLCGFANFASVGIIIGGVGSLAPNKRPYMSQYGFVALLGSTLVALMSAVMVGMVI
ncbi:MAG: nucleoside transporter C-terminal domain-containing protein [Rikenellaceae bacterium]